MCIPQRNELTHYRVSSFPRRIRYEDSERNDTENRN